MDSSSPRPDRTQNAQQPTGWARPDDYDSEIEGWFEDAPPRSKVHKSAEAAPSRATGVTPPRTTEAAPSKFDKGKSIVVEDSPYSPVQEENSSESEGAPEEGFSEFTITFPDSSPEPYQHPKIEAW